MALSNDTKYRQSALYLVAHKLYNVVQVCPRINLHELRIPSHHDLVVLARAFQEQAAYYPVEFVYGAHHEWFSSAPQGVDTWSW